MANLGSQMRLALALLSSVASVAAGAGQPAMARPTPVFSADPPRAVIDDPGCPTPECVPSWNSWGAVPGMDNAIAAVTTWDPDGFGPAPRQLVAGGWFTTAGGVAASRIARWDGTQWQPFGPELDNGVGALTTWDPDGLGPLPEQLVAGGSFATAGGVLVNGIARWDGAQWQPFGSGMGGATSTPTVSSLATWDPDGFGPAPRQLVAGGWFTTAGGVSANYIARWDGAQWQPFGSGMGGTSLPSVTCLTAWDPDGFGPEQEQLVAGGGFTTAGGVMVNYIARWDGAQWQRFGSGMNYWVYAIATWDPDGFGPLPAYLVAGGIFSTAGGVSARNTARWDGTQWQSFGSGMNGDVYALTTFDPDGPIGGIPAQLVAGGGFTTAGGVAVNYIARWDGAQWQPLGSGTSNNVSALAAWAPEGSPFLQLAAAGSFISAGGVTVNRIASWDFFSQWQSFGKGMDDWVAALSTWDPDGAGPLTAQLVAAGLFTAAGGVTVNYIARLDGSQWRPVGLGVSFSAYALTRWDPDGPGPLSPQLVAGGSFITAGGGTVNYIARWDGSRWQPCGSGMEGSVSALSAWDPDGSGPLVLHLVAGGGFSAAGGVSAGNIARWDGTQWLSFGSGMNNQVRALATWDPDGAGPLPERLVAAGGFTTAGGVAINRIAGWDGALWQPLGSGMNNWVYSLTTWDPDGAGPLPPQLVAGGDFITAGGVTVNRIARWDGAQWQPLGSGMNSSVMALATWDPDGLGPLPEQLVAGGHFTTAGGVAANRIARWDGSQWQSFGSGMNSSVHALATWDPDGTGPLYPGLVAGGDFSVAGGIPAGKTAWWGCTSAPPCAGTGSSACSRADWNEDGVIDFNDFLGFLNTFNAQDPCADLNADGAVDFNDLLEFLNLFNAGC